MADEDYGGAGYAPFGDPGKGSFDNNDAVPPNAFSEASTNPGERNTGVDSRYLGREDRIDALYYKNQNNGGNLPQQQVIKGGPKVNYYANGSQNVSSEGSSLSYYKPSYSRFDNNGVRRFYAINNEGQEVETKPDNLVDKLSDEQLQGLLNYFLTKDPEYKIPEFDPSVDWGKKRIEKDTFIDKKDEDGKGKEDEDGKEKSSDEIYREGLEKKILKEALDDVEKHKIAETISSVVSDFKKMSENDKVVAEQKLRKNTHDIMLNAMISSKSKNK